VTLAAAEVSGVETQAGKWERAAAALTRQAAQQQAERGRIHRDRRPVDLVERAAAWRTRAQQARIESLPITEAAQLLRDRAASAELERIAVAQAKAVAVARAAKLARFPSPSSDHRRSGPERDAPGLSL
jgi:hypothetical protein